jgi:single-strand DNA-binding protein
MNRVILSGHLGNDVTIRAVGETSVCQFSLATKYKDQTEWHRIKAWGATAVNCNHYLEKGSKVLLEGRISYHSYEKDGVKKHITEIIAEKVELLDSKAQRPDDFDQTVGPSLDDIPF